MAPRTRREVFKMTAAAAMALPVTRIFATDPEPVLPARILGTVQTLNPITMAQQSAVLDVRAGADHLSIDVAGKRLEFTDMAERRAIAKLLQALQDVPASAE